MNVGMCNYFSTRSKAFQNRQKQHYTSPSVTGSNKNALFLSQKDFLEQLRVRRKCRLIYGRDQWLYHLIISNMLNKQIIMFWVMYFFLDFQLLDTIKMVLPAGEMAPSCTPPWNPGINLWQKSGIINKNACNRMNI